MKMIVLMQLLVLSLGLLSLVTTISADCSTIDQILDRGHLASKTPYAATEKDFSLTKQYKEEVSGTCQGTVKQLWLVTRHGARYPIKSELQKMSAILPLIAQELVFNFKEGRGCLTEAEAQELEKYSPPYSTRDNGQLHEAGADEQFGLGEYWKQRFPDLFDQPYSEDLYKVEYTVLNRTSQSAYHFLRGMFGDDAAARIKLPKAREPNYKLKAYSSCPVWQREVLKNPVTRQQQRLYEQHQDFQQMLGAVTDRLGYTDTISIEELKLIFDECRYEASWWLERTSVWCRAFSDEDLQVLSYHEDLKYYYEDSYGGPELNGQIACGAVADLYKKMRTAVEEPSSAPRALLYFSHNKMLLQLLTALGLYQPPHPLQYNNRHAPGSQTFSVSRLTPFSSNLAFVLYACSDGSHRVGGLLQGAPVSLAPLCSTDAAAGARDGSEVPVTCPWPPHLLEQTVDTCAVRRLCHEHDEL